MLLRRLTDKEYAELLASSHDSEDTPPSRYVDVMAMYNPILGDEPTEDFPEESGHK